MVRIKAIKWWQWLLALLVAAGLGGYVLDQSRETVTTSGPSNTGGPMTPGPALAGDPKDIPTEISDEDVGHSNGDIHVRTIDGAYYDLQLVGEFIALKSDRDDLQVQLRTAPWQSTSKTVSTNIAVAMNVAGDRVGVYVRQSTLLHVNGSPVLSLDQPLRLGRGGHVSRVGNRISVVWPDETTAHIDLHGDYLDFSVVPDRARMGTLNGLFGNFDGDASNDLLARNAPRTAAAGLPKEGSEPSTRAFNSRFADSWRISQTESLFDYGPGENTATWTDLKFPYQVVFSAGLDGAARQGAETACKAAGITDKRFLQNCVLDIGVTGDQRFIQSALQAQTDTLLQEGFGCRGLRLGGSRCTYYRPSLQDSRVGGKFQLSVETMDGSSKRVEEFDCAPVDARHRAACKFNTRGRVFEGSHTVERYVAENGQVQELKGTMEKR